MLKILFSHVNDRGWRKQNNGKFYVYTSAEILWVVQLRAARMEKFRLDKFQGKRERGRPGLKLNLRGIMCVSRDWIELHRVLWRIFANPMNLQVISGLQYDRQIFNEE